MKGEEDEERIRVQQNSICQSTKDDGQRSLLINRVGDIAGGGLFSVRQ